jgi:hypothetical protein
VTPILVDHRYGTTCRPAPVVPALLPAVVFLFISPRFTSRCSAISTHSVIPVSFVHSPR